MNIRRQRTLALLKISVIKRVLHVSILVTGILFFPLAGYGQSTAQTVLEIPKMEDPIELDGHIREEEWKQARELKMIQHSPNFNTPPSEDTRVYIGYSEEYIYVACKCYDKGTPSGPSFKRDYYSTDTDYFILGLDTFNDNENAVYFQATPTGLRADVAVSNDATGSNFSNEDWNTYWDVETRITDAGWFAEMRIPVSSLRFQSNEDGDVTMGLVLGRTIADKNETVSYPLIPPNWGGMSPWKPSQIQDVVFPDMQEQKLFKVTPYLLGGLASNQILSATGNTYNREDEIIYDAGLDVKYGLTSNLTLDVTVNTDFAQVEADNQQVNVTRFPLFFPEKRQFFQERSSNFDFNFGGSNRLFYSRRIGLQDGEQVRILGGARVVGRSGPWDIGILNMQTGKNSSLDLASENFGVARLKREVFNQNSYAGGMFVSRVGIDGTYNMAYGLDGLFNLQGDTFVNAKWAQTFDENFQGGTDLLNTSRIKLQLERRNYQNLSYNFQYDRAGAFYQPAVGFEAREDYSAFSGELAYGWVPETTSFLQRHQLSLGANTYYRNADGTLETLEIIPEWYFRSNSGHSMTLGAYIYEEDIRQSFNLSNNVTITSGRYQYAYGTFRYSMPSGEDLRFSFYSTFGRLYDGNGGLLSASPTWNASKYLRLSGSYEFIRLKFDDLNEVFNSRIARLRAEVTPNVKYSIQSFIQYNNQSDNLAANIRFRYNPREGTDLYIVYNEAINADRYAYSPVRPLSQARTLMLKYTYTFDIQ